MITFYGDLSKIKNLIDSQFNNRCLSVRFIQAKLSVYHKYVISQVYDYNQIPLLNKVHVI